MIAQHPVLAIRRSDADEELSRPGRWRASSAARAAGRPDGSGTAMAESYDATTRNLFELNPAEWSAFLGHPVADPGRVRLIDSNLSLEGRGG
jgi:hypothetical protein